MDKKISPVQKKVLQISKFYPPYKGGIELVAQMISRAHQDDVVDVVSFGKENSIYSGEYGETVHQYNTDAFFVSTPFNFSLIYQPSQVLKFQHYDHAYIHIHNPFIHLWLFLFSWTFRENGMKVTCIYHSDIFKGLIGKIFNLFFISTSFVYDDFIVSSPQLKENSEILKFIDPEKIIVNPFPVVGKTEFIDKEKFSKRLLAIGRLVPYKGFSFLIDVINKYPEYQLDIIGNGPMFNELSDRADKHINLHGHVSDEIKEELISRTDVLVVPSLTNAEAYGMISVEAFQKSIPVIASDLNTGVTFLVQNNVTGLIFTPGNEEGLISCLRTLENKNSFMSLKYGCYEFYNKVLDFPNFQERLLSSRSL